VLLTTRKHMCKRSFIKFASNIKLYTHIQEHYVRKIVEITLTKSFVIISTYFFFSIINIDTPSTLSSTKSPISKIFIFAFTFIKTTSITLSSID